MSMDSQTEFHPKGLIFGLLFPGAGHMANGELARGILVAVGVLGLFFGGMFIGGIDVVDSEEDRVWFIGEALVGPLAFAVDWVHQNHFKAYDLNQVRGISTAAELAQLSKRSAYPDETRVVGTFNFSNGPTQVPIFDKAGPGQGPPNKKSLGKVNELGTLFSTIAGMLNLIAVLDAAFPTNRRKNTDSTGKSVAAGAAGVLGVGVVKTETKA